MARILTRPMFRKGGLSQTARPSYRGGGVTAIRPGYRGGGMNGIMSGIVPRTNAYSGYYNTDIRNQIPTEVPITSLIESYKPDDFELPEWAKTKSQIIETPGGKIINVKGAKEVETIPPDYIKETITTPEESNTENGLDEDGKIKKEKIDISSISDADEMKSYMDMFEAAAGTDSDETKRSKYLELAKFGANLLAQPGGDLTGAIGKSAASSIGGLSKQMAGDRDAKRQLRIAGLSAYLKGKDPGSIGKAVKDIMAANPNISKQDALALALRSGTATRESTAESKTQDIATSLYEDGFVESKTKARGSATALQKSVELGVSSTRYSKLPKDKDDRKDGAYYIEPKTGVLGRYNKSTGEIIEPGDPGFKPEKK